MAARTARPGEAISDGPFLCHHMAGARSGQDSMDEVLRSSEVDNIYIKLSGFHYISNVSWDYPHSDTHPGVRQLCAHFGRG